MERIYRWLIPNWVAGVLCVGVMFFLLIPVLATSWSRPILLIFAQLPIYMPHQVEQHTGDRFRTFVNQMMFDGIEALTPASVVVINVPGVWGLNMLALYAAIFFGIGWGLGAVYLTLVNAVSHIGASIGLGRYNPGLLTSVALFLPCSVFALFTMGRQPGVAWSHHAIGVAVAIVIHLATIAFARRNFALSQNRVGASS